MKKIWKVIKHILFWVILDNCIYIGALVLYYRGYIILAFFSVFIGIALDMKTNLKAIKNAITLKYLEDIQKQIKDIREQLK